MFKLNTVKRKKILVATLSLLFVVALALLVWLPWQKDNPRVQADTVTVDIDSVESEYSLYTDEVFPTTVSFSYEGVQHEATNGVLVYPNGDSVVIKENAVYTLSEVGSYTLKYYYKADGVNVVAQKTFFVKDEFFSLTGAKDGSITPVTAEEMGDEKYTKNEDNITLSKKDAWIARMKAGTQLTYAKPIDLRNVDEKGLSEIIRFDPRIRDGATTANLKTIANDVVITLTDCYDPTIYTTILLHQSSALYLRAGTNTLGDTGLSYPSENVGNGTTSKNVYYENVRGIVYYGAYGGGCSYSYVVASDGLSIKYDYVNGKLYAGMKTLNGAEDLRLFADFLNEDIYPNSSYQRFTTGEVFVSIECKDFLSDDYARLDVYSIGGDSAADLMRSGKYRDEKAPEITVDFNATEQGGVYCNVGRSIAIPEAYAVDVNLAGTVETNVYLNYYSDSKIAVPVQDNRFTVGKEDIYYVEYTARDKAGNTSKTVIKFFGIQGDVLTIDVGGQLKDILVAEEYDFPIPSVQSVNNADDIRLKIELISERETVLIADLKNKEEIEAFEASGKRFSLLYAADYTVKYTYADNAFIDEYSYSLTVKTQAGLIKFGEPFAQRYFIKGGRYDLQTVSVYGFDTGEPALIGSADVYVAFDGSEQFAKLSSIENVKITGNSSVQFKYQYQDKFILSKVIDIVDVDYEDADQNGRRNGVNYFVGDFRVEDDYQLVYLSNTLQGDNSLQFVNMVSMQNFSFSFTVKEDYSHYERVNFIFTDPYAPENRSVFSMYKNNGLAYVQVNGGASYPLTLPFATEADDVKNLLYSTENKIFQITGLSGVIKHDLALTTPFAYFDIELCGISSEAGIWCKELNTQPLSKNLADNKPAISCNTLVLGDYAVGDTVTIYPAQFIDVLSTITKSNLSVSVKFENVPVTAVGDVVLDGVNNDPTKAYQFTLSKSGEYVVVIGCTDEDGSKRFSTVRYTFKAVDFEKPTITFHGDVKENVRVTLSAGSALTLDYSVADNVSAVENITSMIVILNMDTGVPATTVDKTIVFQRMGTYKVSVVCVDEAGNLTDKSFIVVVQ